MTALQPRTLTYCPEQLNESVALATPRAALGAAASRNPRTESSADRHRRKRETNLCRRPFDDLRLSPPVALASLLVGGGPASVALIPLCARWYDADERQITTLVDGANTRPGSETRASAAGVRIRCCPVGYLAPAAGIRSTATAATFATRVLLRAAKAMRHRAGRRGEAR